MLRRLALLGLLGTAGLTSGLPAQTPQDLAGAYLARDSARFETLAGAAMAATPHDGTLQLVLARIRQSQLRYADAVAAVRRGLQGDSLRVRGELMLELGVDSYLCGDSAEAHRSLAALAADSGGGRAQREGAAMLQVLGLDPRFAAWTVVREGDLRFHLAPDVQVAAVRVWLARTRTALPSMQRFFQAALPRPLDVYVWSGDATARAAGLPRLARAFPAFSVVHTAPGHTPGHEIAHVVAWIAGGRPARDRQAALVSEGTAVAFDGTVRDRARTARDGMRAAGVTSVSIESLWREGKPDEIIYPVGGLLMQRLIERGGRDRFLQLLADQRLESARAVYDDVLAQVIADVEKELNGG